MTASDRTLHLFEGFGVELEYMIVNRQSLDVMPICDEVIRSAVGSYTSDYEAGVITWSNELALHVIELKTTEPARALGPLVEPFNEQVRAINTILEPMGGRLMPGAMHPWMDPHKEMRLWPHEYSPTYEAFDRIFSCQGHGWANLQSAHLNLPFGNDEEFGRLHAAIRLALPILPGLAASSPVLDARATGLLDNRLEVYRSNARRIPSISGAVIPEAVYSRAAYETDILQRLYADIAPHDPAGILQHEWLNARGAIARFDRDAIEIRVLDVQETVVADLAVIRMVIELVRALCEQRWSDTLSQQRWPIEPLAEIFLAAVRHAETASIDNRAYLETLGLAVNSCTIGGLWRHLAESLVLANADIADEIKAALGVILDEGTLATRMMRVLGPEPSRPRLREVCEQLCDCLQRGVMFRGPGV
ncbi:MAG: hypothetical protein IT430_14275 [Phycisphaerales bacterium]|nr:hypothetical protein [Phycisphaerales bacterium]